MTDNGTPAHPPAGPRRGRLRGGRNPHPALIALLVTAVGAALSLGLFRTLRQEDHEHLLAHFRHSAAGRMAALNKELGRNLEVLEAVAAFRNAADRFDRDTFQEFASRMLEGHDDIRALEWVPRVSIEQRERSEARERSDGRPGFPFTERDASGTLVPAGTRPEYFPVRFVEPLAGNEPALGYDLGSDPARRRALETARDTGRVAGTGRIRLVQVHDHHHGFLLFRPVYRKGAPTETVAERGENLEGFVLGVFCTHELLAAALKGADPEEMNILLLDLQAPAGERLMGAYPAFHSGGDNVPAADAPASAVEGSLRYREEMHSPGTAWVMEASAAPDVFLEHEGSRPEIALILGLLLTATTAALLYSRTRRIRQVQNLAAELASTNHRLQTTAMRLQQALRSSGVGLYDWDIEKNTAFFSTECKRHIGYGDAEIPDRLDAWESRLHPEDRERVLLGIARHLAGDTEDYELEFRLRHKDGSDRWILSRGKVLRNEQGRPLRVLGCHVDLTEKKSTEEQLRLSRERFAKSFSMSPDALVISGLEDGRIMEVNRSWETITGYTREEALGRTYQELRLFANPAQRKRLLAEYEARKSVQEFELDIGSKGGELRTVLLSVRTVPLDAGVCLLSVFRDITERKRMEEALREGRQREKAILDNIPDIAWLKDAESRFIQVNEAFARSCGQPAETLVGRTDLDIWPRELAESYRANDLEVMRSGKQKRVEEPLEDREKAERTWIETIKTPIYDPAGNVIGTTGIARDITERKQAEEERGRLQAQLLQSQKMEAVGTLAGGIAHDFNNILAIMLGFTELALQDLPPQVGPGTRQHLEEVLRAGTRGKDLAGRILTFSRKGTQEMKSTDLRGLVLEAGKFLRASLPSTIEIRMELPEGPAAVLGDATQIHQVLINLCANAGHAMRETGGTLLMRLEREAAARDGTALPSHAAELPSGPVHRLTVSDTGTGMEPEVLRRIFEPFFTTKRLGEGTGMGLAVVHGIVTSHGGSIRVFSEPGRGTTFEVLLPRLGSEPAAPSPDAPAPAGWRRANILLVDDEEALLCFCTQMLRGLGHRVTALSSSLDALQVFLREDAEEFDMVLTDRTMPGLTGIQLARNLREIRPGLPVVLCTGLGDDLTADGLKDANIRAVVMKPYLREDLARTIDAVLEDREGEAGTSFVH